MPNSINWDPPPLSQHDQKLISVYEEIGRPVDDLPYTSDFERLVEKVGEDDSNEARHAVFRRLLGLRKQGRLPRVSRPVS